MVLFHYMLPSNNGCDVRLHANRKGHHSTRQLVVENIQREVSCDCKIGHVNHFGQLQVHSDASKHICFSPGQSSCGREVVDDASHSFASGLVHIRMDLEICVSMYHG